jgi:NADH-quinone oxidoreductase subunit L
MGGLWKDLRLVAILFAIGSLALAGIPPFAGFFSKDEVLGNVLARAMLEGGTWWYTYIVLVVTAAVTAFYTTRLFVLTFLGTPADPHRHVHPVHPTMIFALLVLAALSAGGGFLGHTLEHFVHPGFVEASWHAANEELIHHAHSTAMAISIVGAFGGVAVGLFLYLMKPSLVDAWVATSVGASARRMSENKFYIDEIYDALVVQPVTRGSMLLWGTVDRMLIDWLMVEGAGRAASGLGAVIRRTQAGAVNLATSAMLVGTVAVLAFLLLRVANG